MQTTRATDFVGCTEDAVSREKSELGCMLSCESEETCVTASYHTTSGACKTTGDNFSNHCKKRSAQDYILIKKVKFLLIICTLILSIAAVLTKATLTLIEKMKLIVSVQTI